ncbi:MAG: thioredoxin-disulfide reductase [Candidatus Coatesbacteria bacterium]|nr:thioredoxin-disulfide reductase [Candidatus Coatesbacteria bacterium]
MQEEQIVIIGAGVAGLSSAIYAARAYLNPLVLEQSFPGGLAATTYHIDNYPGFPEGISGTELVFKMSDQARKFGARIESQKVISLKYDRRFNIKTEKSVYISKAVIIASGCVPNKLNIPGETELVGRGVSYCANCDGAFFKNKVVAVVGGGDAAVSEAIFLTRFASKVYIIHRRKQFRASKYLEYQARNNDKIELVLEYVPLGITGDNLVNGIVLQNVVSAEEKNIEIDGVFFYTGWKTELDFIDLDIKISPYGFIITDEKMSCGLPGLFAAGDVRQRPLKQIVTACSDGAIAAVSAEHFIDNI